MDIPFLASLASSVIFVIGMAWYVRDVYRARVRVSLVSISLLSLINFSQVGSLAAKELWYIVPFSVTAALLNLLICIIGYRNGRFEIKKMDVMLFIAAVAGLVIWLVTDNPEYNIYILTATVLASIVPIVLKTFNDPSSETKLPWRIILLASLILQLTITSAHPAGWLVQGRQLLFAVLMNAAVSRKRR